MFVGRYRLGPVLGRGGAATVHQALDERLMRQVALKVFRQDADRYLVRRFEAEARLLARLHHPGLVEVFDFGHTAQGPYLALELLPGPPLGVLLRSGPRSLAETLRTGLDLARTLEYVHSQGVVHRDVKPSNILLDQDGRPRLADFGISRAVDTAGSTRTGMIMGTAAYLAPEQVHGRGAGPEADVYALALVLIECLTGEREYPGPAAESAVARLRRSPQIPAGLPWTLTQALDHMTRTDPTERISASECAKRLSAVLEQRTAAPPATPAPLPESRVEPDQHANPPAHKRRWVRPAAVAITAIAGSGLIWSLVAAGPQPSSAAHTASSPVTSAHPAPTSTAADPDASATPRAHGTGPAPTATRHPSAAPATAPMPTLRATGVTGDAKPAQAQHKGNKGNKSNKGKGHRRGHGH
ncbi:protein kinase [Streptacidiphilus sp. PB12-B1b]|uniref:serine/threonine-protein kinase n=1 Tax=Streptacidiphilus sp. PB12-B1b TaxID=2705012 RepID=UPI0015FC2D9D|nr:serine/threonine-protein kinase [Streptacidiphilus sp. PB12-B1b]QMU76911.1 protein kinase [Streptacidiphilus sp. PB12-B1b]